MAENMSFMDKFTPGGKNFTLWPAVTAVTNIISDCLCNFLVLVWSKVQSPKVGEVVLILDRGEIFKRFLQGQKSLKS